MIANHADYKKEMRPEVAKKNFNHFPLHNNAIPEQVYHSVMLKAIEDQLNEEISIREELNEINIQQEEIKEQVNGLREELMLLLQPGHTFSNHL